MAFLSGAPFSSNKTKLCICPEKLIPSVLDAASGNASIISFSTISNASIQTLGFCSLNFGCGVKSSYSELFVISTFPSLSTSKPFNELVPKSIPITYDMLIAPFISKVKTRNKGMSHLEIQTSTCISSRFVLISYY